jgi:soluble lytic murein transglycosylase-like protein
MRPAVLLILIVLLSTDVYPQPQARGRTTNTWRTRAKLYEPLIASTAERYNIDPHLLWTIAYLESRFRRNAMSYKNGKPCAYGLMQFTGATAARYGLTNLYDPRESLDAAARYVRDLQTRFGPRVDLILAAYNAGEGTVEAFRDGRTLLLPNNKIINPHAQRTGGIPPYKETRHYVAQGGIIYGTLIRTLIFNETHSVDRSSRNNAFSTPTSVKAGHQQSFYSSGATITSSAEPTVKPGSSNQNNSIYAN